MIFERNVLKIVLDAMVLSIIYQLDGCCCVWIRLFRVESIAKILEFVIDWMFVIFLINEIYLS